MASSGARPRLAPSVEAYLAAVTGLAAAGADGIVSVILFGSAATGGFQGSVSDVDLILVLHDGAGAEEKRRLRERVIELEIVHGMRAVPRRKSALETMVERVSASELSFFVCTRGDLRSGVPLRILNIHPAQAFFVDRIVMPGILSGAVTFWGEELLGDVRLEPIRRFDIFKAFFGLINQAVTSLVLFPVLPSATRYAMATMKHSVRSCYFYYQRRHVPLEEEIGYLQERGGRIGALDELLRLRSNYKPSFIFVARCIPALVRMHWRTAISV